MFGPIGILEMSAVLVVLLIGFGFTRLRRRFLN